MMNSYLLTKLDFDSINSFLENTFYGQTTDRRPRHGIIYGTANTVKHGLTCSMFKKFTKIYRKFSTTYGSIIAHLL